MKERKGKKHLEKKKNGRGKGRGREKERKKKRKKKEELWSVHQEATIRQGRVESAGEISEWLSNLLHLRLVILVGLNF